MSRKLIGVDMEMEAEGFPVKRFLQVTQNVIMVQSFPSHTHGFIIWKRHLIWGLQMTNGNVSPEIMQLLVG
jgi:hypothetical protein